MLAQPDWSRICSDLWVSPEAMADILKWDSDMQLYVVVGDSDFDPDPLVFSTREAAERWMVEYGDGPHREFPPALMRVGLDSGEPAERLKRSKWVDEALGYRIQDD